MDWKKDPGNFEGHRRVSLSVRSLGRRGLLNVHGYLTPAGRNLFKGNDIKEEVAKAFMTFLYRHEFGGSRSRASMVFDIAIFRLRQDLREEKETTKIKEQLHRALGKRISPVQACILHAARVVEVAVRVKACRRRPGLLFSVPSPCKS